MLCTAKQFQKQEQNVDLPCAFLFSQGLVILSPFGNFLAGIGCPAKLLQMFHQSSEGYDRRK